MAFQPKGSAQGTGQQQSISRKSVNGTPDSAHVAWVLDPVQNQITLAGELERGSESGQVERE